MAPELVILLYVSLAFFLLSAISSGVRRSSARRRRRGLKPTQDKTSLSSAARRRCSFAVQQGRTDYDLILRDVLRHDVRLTEEWAASLVDAADGAELQELTEAADARRHLEGRTAQIEASQKRPSTQASFQDVLADALVEQAEAVRAARESISPALQPGFDAAYDTFIAAARLRAAKLRTPGNAAGWVLTLTHSRSFDEELVAGRTCLERLKAQGLIRDSAPESLHGRIKGLLDLSVRPPVEVLAVELVVDSWWGVVLQDAEVGLMRAVEAAAEHEAATRKREVAEQPGGVALDNSKRHQIADELLTLSQSREVRGGSRLEAFDIGYDAGLRRAAADLISATDQLVRRCEELMAANPYLPPAGER